LALRKRRAGRRRRAYRAFLHRLGHQARFGGRHRAADAVKKHGDIDTALDAYEAARRPPVDSIQRAAQVSLEWFEETERYFGRLEPLQFAYSMLTRSLRIQHANLKLRDPKLITRVDRWFAGQARINPASISLESFPPPPMFTPFRLREMVVQNRVVVSPMCQYSRRTACPTTGISSISAAARWAAAV